eukprot:TRINITY_DN35588_c0_g1_i1.p1 TRINITY_DN35588_c0_g1~~TRINITY_DN35588_c0_g1_i1.p1  ORF type:complete len:232 (-),score=14.89 TRINITY_DN35588_c0_g1_i1:245-940(-)
MAVLATPAGCPSALNWNDSSSILGFSSKGECRTCLYSHGNRSRYISTGRLVAKAVLTSDSRKLIRRMPHKTFQEDSTVCPCGGGELRLDYETCCKPYHAGLALEPDAVTLARARYTAYVKGIVDYIVKTTHPQYPEFQAKGTEQLLKDLHMVCETVMFTKFEILDSEATTETQTCVTFRVTFLYRICKYFRHVLKKKNLFVQERNQWFFHGPVEAFKPRTTKNKMYSMEGE